MATLADSTTESSHPNDAGRIQAENAADTAANFESRRSSFVNFTDKQATVFVNSCHIVRFEYHPSTGRAHLQLTDGHHYYLSEDMAERVIKQLKETS